MTKARVITAFLGGMAALFSLGFGIYLRSADAWRLFLSIAPLLAVFVWWVTDRAALERRIRRLEARSEIADERRVTARGDLTDLEHRLDEVESRLDESRKRTSPRNPAWNLKDPPDTRENAGLAHLRAAPKPTAAPPDDPADRAQVRGASSPPA
jgi:hypothetical protein